MLFDDLSLSLEKTIRTVPHLSIYSRLVDMMPPFQTCFRAFFRQNFAHWGRSIRYLGMNFGIAMVSVVSVVSVVVEIPRHFGQSTVWLLAFGGLSCFDAHAKQGFVSSWGCAGRIRHPCLQHLQDIFQRWYHACRGWQRLHSSLLGNSAKLEESHAASKF